MTGQRKETGGGTIQGLANFYNRVTKILFWLFAVGCVIGLIFLFVELNKYRPNALVAFGVLSVSLLGIIAVGATAVLLDIMHNVRSINKKKSDEAEEETAPESEHDQFPSPTKLESNAEKLGNYVARSSKWVMVTLAIFLSIIIGIGIAFLLMKIIRVANL